MATFFEKPKHVDAWQYLPGGSEPAWMKAALNAGTIYYQGGDNPYLTIDRGGEKQRAELGDYIVRDFQRIFFVVERQEFEARYEPIGAT